MYYSSQQWLDILYGQDATTGLFVALIGLSCVMLGWRLAPGIIAVDYLLIGGLFGRWIGLSLGPVWLGWTLAALFGLGLAAIAWVVPRKATILMTAIIGAYFAGAAVCHLEGSPPPALIAGTLGFVMTGALAVIVYDHIVVVLTSLHGALLAVGGLLMIMATSPSWYGGVRDLVVGYSSLLPLLVFAPTLIGTLFQLSSIQQHDSGQE